MRNGANRVFVPKCPRVCMYVSFTQDRDTFEKDVIFILDPMEGCNGRSTDAAVRLFF